MSHPNFQIQQPYPNQGNYAPYISYVTVSHSQIIDDRNFTTRTTLISLINVEVGINMEGGIFWKKLVHKFNKRGVEGGKI